MYSRCCDGLRASVPLQGERKVNMSNFMLQEMRGITVSSVRIADPVIPALVIEVWIVCGRANMINPHFV
jgi:hypothetical protein